MNEQLHLVAHVAGRGFLIDAARVDSVVEMGDVAPAPGAASAVRGLAAIRSRVATVVDTRRLLDLPDGGAYARTTDERAIVTMVDGHLYAVVVDTLADVAPFAVQPPPDGVALDGGWGAISGVAERDGETLLALDLARLLARLDA